MNQTTIQIPSYRHAHKNPDICRHYNNFIQASCMQTSEAFSISLSVGKTLPPIKSISVIINALRNEDLKWYSLCIVPFRGLLRRLSLTVTCWTQVSLICSLVRFRYTECVCVHLHTSILNKPTAHHAPRPTQSAAAMVTTAYQNHNAYFSSGEVGLLVSLFHNKPGILK